MNFSSNQVSDTIASFRMPDRSRYPELDGYTRDEIYEDFFGGGGLYLAARMVRAMQKYFAPSGMIESCVRMLPGDMNALCTFQRGQEPEKRAKRMPEAEKRLDVFPAMSTRTKWNGTPDAPGLWSVVRRWQTCSKLVRKR